MKTRRLGDATGLIAGLMWSLLGIAAPGLPIGAWAQTLTTLHSFTGGSDGDQPFAGLISDASGALYGTTLYGGSFNNGTVFKLAPPTVPGGVWTESIVRRLTGFDGVTPLAGLMADASGALYGTAIIGGTVPPRLGTVFKLTPPPVAGGAWIASTLHTFTGGDGANPVAGLSSDTSGALYGTTRLGGAADLGTVFKLTPPPVAGYPWTASLLHSFTGSDGAEPWAGLISDAAGALYGTTRFGGAGDRGTVFKVTPPTIAGGAWTGSVLYSFTGGDGAEPVAGLMADASGALYGTTEGGGAANGGTVFKLTPPTVADGAWTESVLYSFTGGDDGGLPRAVLISDASGALYGTTQVGGAAYRGTVFKLTPPTVAGGAWTGSILHSFTGSDGANPFAGLISDASGALYGTTRFGGAADRGTVFKLTVSARFAGVPGQPNCTGQSVAFLAHEFGGIAHAATALGYASVPDLHEAIAEFCGN